MRTVFHSLFCFMAVLMLSGHLFGTQLFIALDGDDSNPGSIEQPLQSFSRAVALAIPGDTLYVRGGVYPLTTTLNIADSKSGSDSSRYSLFAYPDERPLIDFSSQNLGSKGISLKASYWHIQGLDVTGAGDNGIEISGGSHNIIEFCAFYENRDTGLQLSNGASNNQIINCDSYYNADPTDYGDADGFAPKLAVGSDNYFYGCRAWGNCDDGWDGYMRGATDVTTILENCWTWGNGYLKDGSDPGSQANGNGFKMGGGDASNSEKLMHHFMLKNCLAFGNKGKGFDQNHNMGSMTLFHCTGYGNKTANYRISESLNAGQTLTVKNCVSFYGSSELGSFAIQETNSWMSPFQVTADDFISLEDSSAFESRKADGSLPDIDFLRLSEGSDLIDAGVDAGIPFFGNAPDLGAFESPFTSSALEDNISTPTEFHLAQNYPNPFNPETIIPFDLPKSCRVTLTVFNLNGQKIETLIQSDLDAGPHDIVWRPTGLPSGMYLYRLETAEFTEIRKLVLQK